MPKIGKLWQTLPPCGQKHHRTRSDMRGSLCLIAQRDPTIVRSRLPRRPLKTRIGQANFAGDLIAAQGDLMGERMCGIQNSTNLMAFQKSTKAVTAAKTTMIRGHSQLFRLARRPG